MAISFTTVAFVHWKHRYFASTSFAQTHNTRIGFGVDNRFRIFSWDLFEELNVKMMNVVIVYYNVCNCRLCKRNRENLAYRNYLHSS